MIGQNVSGIKGDDDRTTNNLPNLGVRGNGTLTPLFTKESLGLCITVNLGCVHGFICMVN
jgi:hypothetical protein